MFTPSNNTLLLPLIFILLIGFSINVCGDSEEAEVLIDEEAEPLVVTIIDGWPSPTKRPDAEILADKILERETDDFYFDLHQRTQLVSEIEGVLSLIRAAYPLMSEIHAEEKATPGMLWIHLERDFYEILKEMLQDKQGQIRFETGNAEFDALNAKLGVQKVRWDSWGLSLYLDRHLNFRVAIEAYSMVEGVREVWRNPPVEVSADIKAFKQGETWYFIFRTGWGDCAAGCLYHESFCFTVRGIDVESIPTAQAQMMPPFQELDPSLHNNTPLVNAVAHTWSWWGYRRHSTDYNLGCSFFGEIEAFPNLLSVSCGYRVEELPREDWFFDNYDFTGVVLWLATTRERTVVGNPEAPSTIAASKPVRVAKTAAEIQNPENVYFKNVLVPIDPPPLSSPFERWWGAVRPTFIVCWDYPETGQRAYQFIEINFIYAGTDEARNHPVCDKIRDTDYIQTLGASFRSITRNDIDEVLPRP